MEDNNKNKKIVKTFDSTFLNTDSVFVEYNDIIKYPFFLILFTLKSTEGLQMLIGKNNELEDLDLDSMFEWYINRKDKNVFKSLTLPDGVLSTYFENDDEKYNEFVTKLQYRLLDEHPELLDNEGLNMNFTNALEILVNGSMVKNFYVYSEVYSSAIDNDLKFLYDNKVNYVSGKLEDVLKENNVSPNSTFVFSNMENILALENTGLLNYSSIIIPDGYGYNYKDNEKKEYVIDMDRISNSYIFKLDFFDNIYV